MDVEDASVYCTVASNIKVSTGFQSIRQQFDPVAHGLDVEFRLTKFIKPREQEHEVLQEILKERLLRQERNSPDINEDINGYLKVIYPDTISVDLSVTSLRHEDLMLVQATDYLYPLCEDPYVMGWITCVNVLSPLYAIGVTECDNMLILLTVSNTIKDRERNIVIPLMIKGFKDCAREAGTNVTNGQTECQFNPWVTMGGIATSVWLSIETFSPDNAIAGDLLILTKPLGTQIAITAHRWLDEPEVWDKVKHSISKDEVRKAYLRAIDSMVRLNKVASCLMHKYSTRGATDVRQCGLLGHAQNLAKIQKSEVSFVIYNIPIIAKMAALSKVCGKRFPILEGYSEEISGGLLICCPRTHVNGFLEDIKKYEGRESWIVGTVEVGNRTARLAENPSIIEVPSTERGEKLW